MPEALEFDAERWLDDQAIRQTAADIFQVLNAEWLVPAGGITVLQRAAFTHVIVLLNDLLAKCAALDHRITFDDDVIATLSTPKDVTSLVRDVRNAVCHLGSPQRRIPQGSLTWAYYSGVLPNAIVTADATYGCDYADDVAVQFGPLRIYLRRHVVRAFHEACRALEL